MELWAFKGASHGKRGMPMYGLVDVTGRGLSVEGKRPGITGYAMRYVQVLFGIPKLPSLSR